MLVSIITPVLNEEDTVKIFVHEIDRTFSDLIDDYEIVFIDDGSIDRTVERIVDQKKTYPSIRLIKLSRNFGKEAALSAGLDYAKGDAVIPMDVDLQDPPEIIPELIRTYETGFDVVLARRIERSTDGLIKKYTAVAFYKIIRKLSTTSIPENVGDFRIISRKVVDSLKRMKETQRFMKGIFSWPGYKTAYVDYSRPVRAAGETKFNG